MARRGGVESINIDLRGVIETLARERNLDVSTVEGVLEEALQELFEKHYGTTVNVFFDSTKGSGESVEVWIARKIVEDSQYEGKMDTISVSEARKANPQAQVGETFYDKFDLNNLNRTDIFRLLKILENKIIHRQFEGVFSRYERRLYQLVTGEVVQIKPDKYILHDEDKNKLELPKSEIIPTEAFRLGAMVKAVPIKVEISRNTPRIILSRTREEFLLRLLEQNVPEIVDGIVKVIKVVREPGLRAKVVVDTTDDRIDPVMACVGPRGSRINPIVRELNNENIDIVRYSPVLSQMVANVLAPARVLEMEIDEKEKKVKVVMKPNDVPLAIGKGGANISLAQKIIGYTIEIYRENEQVDIPLKDLNISIEPEILTRLLRVGCETARDLLLFDINDLVEVTQIPHEKIKELKREVMAQLEKRTSGA